MGLFEVPKGHLYGVPRGIKSGIVVATVIGDVLPGVLVDGDISVGVEYVVSRQMVSGLDTSKVIGS
ncbi:hypothetical protein AMS69_18000 [Haloarcula rubripromontorii]|uniref:Uncharacterized protein n=1 Tax=Haloarcula rubripromontorii TaxID=1705562 RepID=A0A0N0U8P8_9EURY|nr:hypothetical protein [Haloarcula rubripromontorii]KOX91614.1 hypothetical protein AMS69_18000 [Haloarcula rubripromontorii]